ncbi:MAG: electron transfer flavoprotein subunit alpha/FixB family protein [Bacteroidales bacterium]
MSVIVYTENWDGSFKKLSFELASYAVKLAEMLGTEAVALTIGNVEDKELTKLGQFGLRRVINLDNSKLTHFDSQEYARIIAGVVTNENARLLVMADNNAGKSLAPRISVRLKAGLASGVNHLPSSLDPFTISKKVFSGHAFARMELKTGIKCLTLAQNSFELIDQPETLVIERGVAEPDSGKMKTRVLDTQKQTGQTLLTDAEIVVSGGRGMKSPDNWGPLVELAELLGGATACSRPVSDEGWRPHEEHTGQTGKIIAPNLYIAIGISGATQHLAGISSSKYIVAINSDKDAPIFDAAQYGMVGDAAKILPGLIEAVKEMKSS